MNIRPEYGFTFRELRESINNIWRSYVEHGFVEQLRSGRLPRDCYLGYLRQDYVFLKHFARAWALLVVKLDDIDYMRTASQTLVGIMDVEIPCHVKECAEMGISEADLNATQEGVANVAYTRFVIDTGVSGDALELLVALAPCILGYGEIGISMKNVELESHPYSRWIREYSCDEYQKVCKDVGALIDALVAKTVGGNVESSPRWEKLRGIFETATSMEAAFWKMSLTKE